MPHPIRSGNGRCPLSSLRRASSSAGRTALHCTALPRTAATRGRRGRTRRPGPGSTEAAVPAALPARLPAAPRRGQWGGAGGVPSRPGAAGIYGAGGAAAVSAISARRAAQCPPYRRCARSRGRGRSRSGGRATAAPAVERLLGGGCGGRLGRACGAGCGGRVNGSPFQLHLHLAATGAVRHGRPAHQR